MPGYEIACWERGYGDFALAPDLATLRRIPWLEATALVLCDVDWEDGSPVRPSPRQVLRAQVERARGARLRARCSARSSSSTCCARPTRRRTRKRYRDLTPSVPYILDYHILATTYDEPLIRADPERDARAPGISVETSKGEAWPGQHEINFRYADALTMADNHVDLQERRQGDRAPERLLDHVHGEARPRVDRHLVPHPLVAVARRRERVCRRDATSFRSVPRRLDRVRARAGALLRADDQLVQALRRRVVGADDARVGARQPHVRVPRRRARRRAAGRDAHPGRRRQPVSRVRGAARRGAARDRARARARRRRSRGTRTSPTRSGSRRRCARRSPRSRRARWRARRSATRSSTTT